MPILKKSLILISLAFIVRLIFSCCNCPETIVYYQFQTMETMNLDNSTWVAKPTDYDVMQPAAVAFEITLTDTLARYDQAMNQRWKPQLNAAHAVIDCFCPFHYYPEPKMSRFSIHSLLDYAPGQPAGSDITGSFVWQYRHRHLYRNMDSLLQVLNEPFYDDGNPRKTFQFFCRDSMINDTIQLVFRLEFENGEILADTTNQIAIRRSGENGKP